MSKRKWQTNRQPSREGGHTSTSYYPLLPGLTALRFTVLSMAYEKLQTRVCKADRSLKRTCEARETAQAMSGLVLVDSRNKAPRMRCPRLIHSKCSGLSWSGGSGSSFLRCSSSSVVHLVLKGIEEACSSNKASVYVAW